MPKKSEPTANLLYENQLRAYGYRQIVGIDEAGRGPWAGPVAAGAVCLPLGDNQLIRLIRGVQDSKVMAAPQREFMSAIIKETARAWGIGSASNHEIDMLGIIPATKLAMERALTMLQAQFPLFKPDCLFLDALVWPEKLHEIPQVTMIDGDAHSLSIAAASVLAKVWRDEHMAECDTNYPEYGFGVHKGYGTARHTEALKQYGPCPIHRLSFKPVKKIAEKIAQERA